MKHSNKESLPVNPFLNPEANPNNMLDVAKRLETQFGLSIDDHIDSVNDPQLLRYWINRFKTYASVTESEEQKALAMIARDGEQSLVTVRQHFDFTRNLENGKQELAHGSELISMSVEAMRKLAVDKKQYYEHCINRMEQHLGQLSKSAQSDTKPLQPAYDSELKKLVWSDLESGNFEMHYAERAKRLAKQKPTLLLPAAFKADSWPNGKQLDKLKDLPKILASHRNEDIKRNWINLINAVKNDYKKRAVDIRS